ncbi:MAG: hypothetical protein KGL39_40195 [Patescibacteria group bacterium]|nr:hypothetical protein [Patescibacteria group bacterium]
MKNALTWRKEHSWTEKPHNIAEWAKFFQFETLGDSQLTEMLQEAARFILDAKEKRCVPRWLSMSGSNGAGKTYLLKRMAKWANSTKSFNTYTDIVTNEIKYKSVFVHWPKLAKELQDGGGRGMIEEVVNTQLVFLDDICAARDKTGFITGELSSLLSRRVGKWTAITSNLSVEQIAEKVDPRVASRLIRDGNCVVEVDVPDYWLRKIRSQTT